MKSSPSTSISDERMISEYSARYETVSTKNGSARWFKTSAMCAVPVSVDAADSMPPDGKMFHVTENSMIISRPNQNSGIEYRISVNPRAPLSNDDPHFQPWRIPIQIPRMIDAIVDVPMSSTVGQIAWAISVDTGWLSNVKPRLPWALCFR